MATSRREDEPTPNGGAYSVTYFFDKEGQPADETVATRCEIIEFDSSDNEVSRTYGTFGEDTSQDEELTDVQRETDLETGQKMVEDGNALERQRAKGIS